MNGFEVFLAEPAIADLTALPRNIARRVTQALEERATRAPERYGRPLRGTLHGLWKIRVGDLRILYEVRGRRVCVWGVLNRRDAYREILRRWVGGGHSKR